MAETERCYYTLLDSLTLAQSPLAWYLCRACRLPCSPVTRISLASCPKSADVDIDGGEAIYDDVEDTCSSVSCPSDTHRPIDDAESTICLVNDDFLNFPTQFSDDDAFAGGSFSFYYDDDDNDFTSDDQYFFTYEEPYSFEFDYCDVSTCCVELECECVFWGPSGVIRLVLN